MDLAESRTETPPASEGAPGDHSLDAAPKHWKRWIELRIGGRERNVAPYRQFVRRTRERILARCRSFGIDTDRLGLDSDESWREIIEAQREVTQVLRGREPIVLVDQGTWAVDTLAGRAVVTFPGPDAPFVWKPPDDEAAAAELRRVHACGARHFVFAAAALWWLEYYPSFAAYLTDHGQLVLRNERVAVFTLRPAASAPAKWRPRARGEIAQRRAARVWGSLFFTPAIHCLLPDELALGLAALVGRALWLHPAVRSRALARATLVLSGTGRAGDERRVARDQLVEATLRAEAWMRPWLSCNCRVEGVAHLDAARRSGRGVLLVSPHIGMHVGVGSLAAQHTKLALLAGKWVLAHEHESAVQFDPVMRERVRWIYPGRAFEQLRAVLEHGDVCAISFDVAGGAKTTFLGKPAMVARGPAGLAMATGALVITGWADRRGRRPFVKLNAPVDPRRFDSAEDLTLALANTFSEEILRRPEALAPDPALVGVWSEMSAPYAWAFR
jgi:lauroyl/myristoyl acyltransferase